jgi:hypothetical protein
VRPGVERFQFPINDWGKISLSKEEEVEAYNQCLRDVMENPRYYLDNLQHIKEFQVGWLYYGSKEYCMKVKRNYAISHPKGK